MAKGERGNKKKTILIVKSLFTVMDSFQIVESDYFGTKRSL
jgi:hypothetical protein